MKRNNSVEALRFLFICVICLWHFHSYATWISHGYVAVEFFFMLSGFYLYQSYKKHQEIGVLDYTLHKVKKFMPPFLIAFFLLILLDRKQYIYFPETFAPDAILDRYFIHIHELLLCQSIGLTTLTAVNHPLWFLSVLLLAGGMLYSLLRNYPRKSVSLFIPAFVVFGINYMLMTGSHSLEQFGNSAIPGLNFGFVRGFTEMGLGICLAHVYDSKYSKMVQYRQFINVGGVLFLIGYLLMILSVGNYDYLAFVFIPVILICCHVRGGIFKKLLNYRIFSHLGALSMYMYFIHLFVAYLYWIATDFLESISDGIIVGAYLATVIVAAYLLRVVSNLMVSLIKKFLFPV